MAEIITAELVWMTVSSFLTLANNAKGCRARLKGLARRLDFLQSHWESMALSEKELKYIYEIVNEASAFLEKELCKKGSAKLRSIISPATTAQLAEFENRISELRDDLFATMRAPQPTPQSAAWHMVEDVHDLKAENDSVKAIPTEELDKILDEKIPATAGHMESLVDITPAFPLDLRAPLDLLVVLDVSDSMKVMNESAIEKAIGRKLNSSDYCDGEEHTKSETDGVKTTGILKWEVWEQAVKNKATSPLRCCQDTLIDLLDRLRPDIGDRLAIVTFCDSAQVLVPLQLIDSTRMQKLIEGITTNGGTNMEAALRVAFQHLSEVNIEPNRLVEIWFLTDGVPSGGESSPIALKMLLEQLMETLAERLQSRPTFSAIGYKEGCDSEILRMLGEEGGGQMHMIIYGGRDPKPIVKSALDKLLNNAFRTVCKNIDVFCTVNNGVILGEPVTSFRYDQDDDQNIVIAISDLRRNEPKTFIVRYTPKKYPCSLSIVVRFYNVISKRHEEITIVDVKDALLV